MSLVVSRMAESSESQKFCRYTTVKIDSDLLPVLRIAAAMSEQKIQDYLSDLVNENASKKANRKPIKRKLPPPPKQRGPKAESE